MRVVIGDEEKTNLAQPPSFFIFFVINKNCVSPPYRTEYSIHTFLGIFGRGFGALPIWSDLCKLTSMDLRADESMIVQCC